MSEFKLSYTANEINEKLGKINDLISPTVTVEDIAGGYRVTITDKNGPQTFEVMDGKDGKDGEGGSGGGGAAIIDVVELPAENINENCFYRLMTAKWVMRGEYVQNGSICYCVNNLPESGQVVTDFNMDVFVGYYNVADNEMYGYVDTMLGSGFGVSAGWYPFSALAQIAGLGFNGIVTDIEDLPDDNGYFGVLLNYDFYIYKNGWCKVPFAYEKAPEFDVTWDGVIGDRFALDMSALGFTGISIIKISDIPILADELLDCNVEKSYINGYTYSYTIEEAYIDTGAYPGGITVCNGEIVSIYSADEANTALGLPTGYLTNGLYFFYNRTDECWISSLTAPCKVVKIDEMYLPDMSIDIDSLGLHSVATSGNYNDLYNKPNLSDYVTTTEVETMISNAIGSAIGGSY